MEDIQTIIISVLFVVGFLAFVYAFKRWIYSNDPAKLAEFRDLILSLIYEAENLLGSEAGKAKLDWVILHCREAGIFRWIPEKLLIELINLVVFVLNETRWRQPWPGSDTGGDDGPAGPGPAPEPGPGPTPTPAAAPVIDALDAMLYAGLMPAPSKRARRPKVAASNPEGSGEASQPASDGGQAL